MKKLYRSDKNRIIAGVLGGLGEYLNIDPTILRLVFVLFDVLTGFIPFIVLYFVAAVIIPKKEE